MAIKTDSTKQKSCNMACYKVVKFMTDKTIEPNIGISLPPYTRVDGFRYINIFVEFSQNDANEQPVNLGVIFAFSTSGAMGARRYVNLEQNVNGPQNTNFIEVSGQGSWHGSPHNKSSYMVRFPIMGPFVEVFLYNKASVKRTVSVWGYLVS